MLAVAQSHLSLEEYVGRMLEQAVPQETSKAEQRVQPQPITQEAIERLHRLRKQILQENNGQLFEDSAEMLRQQREERTQQLMGE